MRCSGITFATTTHLGTSCDRGAFRLDVSYPLIAHGEDGTDGEDPLALEKSSP